MMRSVVVVLCIALIGSVAWILSLPNKAECVASGRTVDPTERHCQDAGGYQQLEEHAAFHGAEVAVGVAVLLAGGYGVWRLSRRRSGHASRT